MAGETTGQTGTGTAGATGTNAGTAPVGGGTTGGAGGGTGAPAGAATGTPQNPQSGVDIVEEAIPELRGKSAAEKKFILSNLTNSFRAAQAENQKLKQQLSSRGAPAAATSDPDDKGKSKGKEKPLEERVLEDPRSVIAEVAQELYGGTVENVNSAIGSLTLRTFRQDNPDFKDHEQDVLAILEEAQAPLNERNLQLAYESVLGRKTLEARRIQAAAAAGNPDIPVDTGEKPKAKEPEGLEKQMMIAHGMTPEQWQQYKEDQFEIKVPTGKKKETTNA